MAGSVRKEGTTWYYILERNENGKRKQTKKRGFPTKKEAQKALVEAQSSYENGTYIKPSTLLLKDYMKEWMLDKQHSISRGTVKVNESYIRTHIIPILGDIPISKLNAMDVQRFTNLLMNNGLASSTVKRIYNILNTALNKAEKMQLIPKNIASLIDKPKVKRKELDVWTTNEINHFLNIAKSYRYYVAFHLAIMTGMRQGEILGLRWIDIDFERCQLVIRQTLSHDGKEFNVGAKTSSGIRSIALDSITISHLERQKRILDNEKNNALPPYFDNGLVIATSTGNQLFPRDLKKTFDRLIVKADLRKITFHDLRHTHASLLLQQNVHPKIVSERLGHSSIQMTLDTYSHLMPNMQQQVADNLAKMLFPK